MAIAIANTARTELQILQQSLLAIPQVEQVYAQNSRELLRVLIVIAEHDPDVERHLAEIEAQMIDSFTWLDIDFDIVIRHGRELVDILTPKGFQLFAR